MSDRYPTYTRTIQEFGIQQINTAPSKAQIACGALRYPTPNPPYSGYIVKVSHPHCKMQIMASKCTVMHALIYNLGFVHF